jgi:hypothetical protein
MASVLVADLQNGPLQTTCNAKKMASQCNVNSDTTGSQGPFHHCRDLEDEQEYCPDLYFVIFVKQIKLFVCWLVRSPKPAICQP